MDYREKIEFRDGMRIDWDMPIKMDDGLMLRCDIYRPLADGKYPVIMTLGPYGKWLHFEDLYKTQWDRMCADQPACPSKSPLCTSSVSCCRQPLPGRQHPGAVQRRGRRARHRAGRDRRRRDRQRPPLPGRPLPRGVAAGHRRDHPPAAVPRPGRPDRWGRCWGQPLQLIAARSREIADADLVTLVRPVNNGSDLRVEVTIGVGAEDLTGLRVPRQGSLSGRVFTTGQPLRLAHPNDEAGFTSVSSSALDVGPVLVVPLCGSTRVHGVLSVARIRGRAPFDDRQLPLAAAFADQAALALKLADDLNANWPPCP